MGIDEEEKVEESQTVKGFGESSYFVLGCYTIIAVII
jgi:hypothetical protein